MIIAVLHGTYGDHRPSQPQRGRSLEFANGLLDGVHIQHGNPLEPMRVRPTDAPRQLEPPYSGPCHSRRRIWLRGDFPCRSRDTATAVARRSYYRTSPLPGCHLRGLGKSWLPLLSPYASTSILSALRTARVTPTGDRSLWDVTPQRSHTPGLKTRQGSGGARAPRGGHRTCRRSSGQADSHTHTPNKAKRACPRSGRRSASLRRWPSHSSGRACAPPPARRDTGWDYRSV
jgi:hypothetical protein